MISSKVNMQRSASLFAASNESAGVRAGTKKAGSSLKNRDVKISAANHETAKIIAKKGESAPPIDKQLVNPGAAPSGPIVAGSAVSSSAALQVVLAAGSSGGAASTVKRLLAPDAAGNIHEEELQYALVVHLLEKSKPGSGAEFQGAFNELLAASGSSGTAGTGGKGLGIEDATKAALQKMVSAGSIELRSAEQINGVTFEAAQLDNFKQFLFDGTGGPNDVTVAVMAIDQAAAKAESALKEFENPGSSAASRALNTPSNGVMANVAITTGDLDAARGVAMPGNGSIDPKGFLWKPISASDGKLVVLLPKSLTGRIASCAVYRELPPQGSGLIETGRFAGDKDNGNRSHFRFGHVGSYYPDKCFVVALLKDGGEVAFEIADTAVRNSV